MAYNTFFVGPHKGGELLFSDVKTIFQHNQNPPKEQCQVVLYQISSRSYFFVRIKIGIVGSAARTLLLFIAIYGNH